MSGGTAQWALQVAVYDRLSTDATLTETLGAAVYDYVPPGARLPYVVIGEVTVSPNDTMGRTGRDPRLTIHTWSREPGAKQLKQMQSRVDELLDRWAPSVGTWNGTQMVLEYCETMRDPDGETLHGVSSYWVHVHE